MIVVLRPEPGAGETLRRAHSLGMKAIAVPLFKVEPVDWQQPDPGRFDAVLVTSANAIRHGGAQLDNFRGLPVHAVGDATATAARNAGFDIASSGDAGVDRLLGSIDPQLRLLHLCGEDRRAPVNARQTITAVAVYRATAVEAQDLSRASNSIALVHSPRAAARLSELIAPADRASIAIAAISDAAAQAAGDGWRAVEAADEPTDEALLALAAQLCQKSAGT